MFLSFNWGIIGDCDLNSEHMRFLGDARFEIFAVYRLANQVKYPATLDFTGLEMKNKHSADDLKLEDL